jgi:hypothetical protein
MKDVCNILQCGSGVRGHIPLTRVTHEPAELAAYGNPNGYILQSAGSVEAYVNMGGVISKGDHGFCVNLVYDPTNGTVSFGNLWRGASPGPGESIFGAIRDFMN